jgi:hypothetical protein
VYFPSSLRTDLKWDKKSRNRIEHSADTPFVEAAMELEAFVAKTLEQIVRGVMQAQQSLAGTQAESPRVLRRLG